MRISLSNVLIVDESSLIALKIKSITNLKVILMNPGAVPTVVSQEKQNVTDAAAIDRAIVASVIVPSVKCTLRFVPSAVRKPKYRFNPAKTDQFIVAIATAK